MIQMTYLRLTDLNTCLQCAVNLLKLGVIGLSLPANQSNYIISIRTVTRRNLLPLVL
jgi:hypothetical protein